ncbi:AAA family ATPase [Sanguibacter sp. A247]|uniref:AAA family ATPase n=1 Tax=unclassified Sanguibacter TaxID=2645534 RepID=UPI003FD823EB
MSTPPERNLRILWFVGASGSGKSDASYWTYSTLLERGIHAARIDTDDLGMCRPAPADDSANFRVKAAGLAAMIGVYRAHGADAVVVSGCVSTGAQAALHTDLVPGADWTIVRLHVDAATRRERLAARERARQRDDAWIDAMYASSLRDDDELDAAGQGTAPFYDHRIDVTHLDRAAVATHVLAVTGWPGDPVMAVAPTRQRPESYDRARRSTSGWTPPPRPTP